jgi:hypothetical protein
VQFHPSAPAPPSSPAATLSPKSEQPTVASRQTIYRCLRRMTGHEAGNAHHDLENRVFVSLWGAGVMGEPVEVAS